MSSYANSGRRAIDAATFLKGKASPLAEGAATANPDVAVASAPTEASTPSASGASEPVSEQSPPLIFKDTTPSGIVEWALPIDHLSASSFGMWSRCPEQWRRRYVLGEKEAPGAALVFGSGFHFAQEHNFRQKIRSFDDLPVSEVAEAFHHGWERELEKYGGVDEVVWGDREKPDTLRTKGEKLAVAYRVAVSPSLQPERIEHEFLLSVPGVPVPLKGFIDFTGTKGTPFENNLEELVVDYKTSSKTVREMKPEWGLQARIYQMESGRRVEYHVAVKTKDPAIITPVDAPNLGLDLSETGSRTVTNQLRVFTKQMNWCYQEFGPNEPWPTGAPFYGWACGYCGFAKDCTWRKA